MAENIRAFSNANSAFKTITVDIFADALIGEETNTGAIEYYLKFTTSARDTGNHVIKSKACKGLKDLALVGNNVSNQHQSWQNSQADYTDINELVADYIYDMVNGHSNNQYGSGVTYQAPMKFT